MKILIRKHPKKAWKHLSQKKYSKEDLKDILFRDPKVFPIGDIFPDVEPAPIQLMLKLASLPFSLKKPFYISFSYFFPFFDGQLYFSIREKHCDGFTLITFITTYPQDN